MATIKFVNANDRVFVSMMDRAKNDPFLMEKMKQIPAEDATTSQFMHHPGTDELPQLIEVQYPPNVTASSHAHDTHEIIAIVQGELHFGKQVYPAGSSVFIPRMTLYSFKSGPEGAAILNFRPARDMTMIFKDEFMAMRGGDDDGDGDGTASAG